MKFLQVNLGKSKAAQDLLLQAATERNVDLLLVSEQPKNIEEAMWFQDGSRRAAVITLNKNISVSKYKPTNHGFVWIEIGDVRVYSCYFSPNDPIDTFKKEIDELEMSLKSAKGEVVVAGDFNSKSPEWGKPEVTKEGI